MQVRYLGDGDVDDEGEGKPCTVFGQVFPVGVWVETDVRKLAGNPMFETEGEVGPSVEELRKILDDRGVKYHPRAGITKLTELLALPAVPEDDIEPEVEFE